MAAFFPSELEWPYAAAGGIENRTYPWPDGQNPSSSFAIYGYCGSGGSLECLSKDIPNVGKAKDGLGKWGQLDLAGSMWEWVLDNHSDFFPQDPCVDCADVNDGTARVIRGGSWKEDTTALQSANRNSYDPPISAWQNVGIRCARLAL